MLKTLFWTNRLMRLTQKVLPLSKKYYLKDTGKMILFSVHNLDLVSNFCDKIIFIDNRHSIFECNNPQNFDVLEKIFFDKCVIKK